METNSGKQRKNEGYVVNITFWHYPRSRAGYKPVNPRHTKSRHRARLEHRRKKESNSSKLK
jgi:hypothetical protein